MNAAVRKRVEPVIDEQWQQMTIDEAIEIAHRNTGISYQKDDPLMAVVSILNAFGEKLKHLMADERKRFSDQFHNDVSGVSEAVDLKVDDVATSIQRVAENLGNENIQTVVSAVAQQAVEGDKIRRAIRFNYFACSVLAALNWFAVGAFYLLLK
ncbi:hypothetical protein [Roseibium polysiphoniae]|uniref:hypothetical protein n=1 Tax=Roseibium polysiphoniae TaxID=2571221 RepID=UPI00329A7119